MAAKISIRFILMYLTYTIFISTNLCTASSSDESSDELTDPLKRIEAVQEKEEQKFANDISALENISDPDLLRKSATKYRKDLKILRIDYLDLSTENMDLKKEIKLAEKILCHLKIKICTLEEIENYEADFDTYEFNNTPSINTTLIFHPDTQLINSQHNLYAMREEYRRQRWSFYLEHCPTEKIKKLKQRIDENSELENIDLSVAIAKLHRKISTDLRDGANALKKYPQDYRLFLNGEENKIIPVLLKGLQLDSAMKKEIDYQLGFKSNRTGNLNL